MTWRCPGNDPDLSDLVSGVRVTGADRGGGKTAFSTQRKRRDTEVTERAASVCGVPVN
jgi:hypothetical protein